MWARHLISGRWRLVLLAGSAFMVMLGLYALLGRSGEPADRPEKLACLTDTPETGPHAGMVWIPGGTFAMGDSVYPEEGPVHIVAVDGFWMDRHEVTNAQFREFVTATGYVPVSDREERSGSAVFVMPTGEVDLNSATAWWRLVKGASWQHPGGPDTSIAGRDHFPVVALTYEDISAYAEWKGRTLPDEAQWEWAARAGADGPPDHEQPADANTWQGIFPLINTAEDGFAGLAPVGCYKANAYGLHDMVGNVWEWTRTPYDDRRPPARVVKGGSFLCAANYCQRYRAAARQRQEEDLGTSHIGFRTVMAGDS
jgi:formylglycine-generating enzyme required for sulfatase activity